MKKLSFLLPFVLVATLSGCNETAGGSGVPDFIQVGKKYNIDRMDWRYGTYSSFKVLEKAGGNWVKAELYPSTDFSDRESKTMWLNIDNLVGIEDAAE